MKQHKIGATLDWAAPVQIGDDYPDLSDWVATSTLRGRGFAAALSCALTFTQGKTILRVSASADRQSDWKPGEAAVDVRLESPDGVVLISPTAQLCLVKPVTEP
ncbi:MAG: hypothetical protein LBQ81_12315 [Zoogloeaceae bacterium]|jgi:hypothetical protein|nr:hypothetical protein [Zoogloeaceae bacterium]